MNTALKNYGTLIKYINNFTYFSKNKNEMIIMRIGPMVKLLNLITKEK